MKLKLLKKPPLVLSIIFLLSSLAFVAFAQNTSTIALFGDAYKEKSNVPRKIFAKALAQLKQLPLKKSKKCYTDIKKSDPNTPSICALKKAKIFPSTKTKKILPNAKVTYDFAIKTLCRTYNWTEKKTWNACSSYAKDHGLLASPISKKISKKKKITYSKLALFIERSIADNALAAVQPAADGAASQPAAAETETDTAETDAEKSFSKTIPLLPASTASFVPVPEKMIAQNFFANIALTNQLPNRFYRDEVYFIEGDFVNKTADEIFAFLCREGQSCEDSINFIEKTTAAGTHFKIPVFFREEGNFQLGIIPGRSGQSVVATISVIGDPLPVLGGAAATQLNINYNLGKTTFSWDGDGSFIRLIIFQDDKRKDYVFRQQIASFMPTSTDFAPFKKGKAGWLVQHNLLQSKIQEITLATQEFSKIKEDEIKIKNMQEVFAQPGKFTFNAEAIKNIDKKAAFTLPNGQVEEFDFTKNNPSAGISFTIEKDLTSAGTYIFEVNNPEGGAVANVPIYVGDAVPLLPDYFALNPPKLDITPIASLAAGRSSLLELINADREQFDLQPVMLDEILNNIAQNHSQNMVDLNFFAHVNPAGQDPEARRKSAGYPAMVHENLGKATSLELVEAGLMRSPIHRKVILDPDMKFVGLGIVKNAQGYLFATQNFSDAPIRENDVPVVETELTNEALNYRVTHNLAGFAFDSTLRNVAAAWSERMAKEHFFGTTDPQGSTLLSRVRQAGINSSITMHVVQASVKKQLIDELFKQAGLNDAAMRKIGLGLAVNNLGELSMTVLYTP